VDGLEDPAEVLLLPAEIRELLVLDQPFGAVDTDLPTTWEQLPDGTAVVTIRVPAGSALRLEGGPPVRISAA
jgi:hypothetical protein